MLSGKTLEIKNGPPRKIIPYVAAVAIIILAIYYLPNYFFLERATADHTAFLLNFFGMKIQTKIIGENVYLANIKIVKDCTGVQVIAVFFWDASSYSKCPIEKEAPHSYGCLHVSLRCECATHSS